MSLGTLYVELGADTAKFVSALDKAANETRKFTRDVSDQFGSLQRIASQTFGAFGDFNPGISKLTFALSEAGEATSSAMKNLQKLPGALGPIAALGAGAAAGIASLGIAALGVAAETAKSVDEMYHMAESSGVSVEALSRLSFVAKQYDIDQESVTRGLQMMANQMTKAAEAGPNALTVFERMGLSIRKSNGDLKDSGPMFDEIIAKLNAMHAAGKTTEAMGFSREIFGRYAGGEMMRIPTDGLQKWSEVADKTGIVISDRLGQASHEFISTLNVVNAEMHGVALGMTSELLPTLIALSKDLEKVGDSAGSVAGDFSTGIPKVIEAVVAELHTFATDLDWLGSMIGTDLAYWSDAFVGFGEVASKALKLDFKGAAASYSEEIDRLKAIDEYGAEHRRKIYEDDSQFRNEVFGGLPPAKPEKFGPGSGDVNLAPRGMLGIPPKDQVADLISQLNQQASAELALAGSISSTTAAEEMRKAAAEADTKILQERNRLMDESRTLEAEVANARKEQQPGDVTKYSQELASVRNYLAELDEAAPQIRLRYQEIALAKSALSTGEEVSIKETEGFAKQITDLQAMIAAYRQGGSAIAEADIGGKLADDKQKIDELRAAYDLLQSAEPGNADALRQLSNAIDQATASLALHKSQLEEIRSTTLDTDIEKETFAFEAQLPALEALSAAYLNGAEAVRKAQVQLKVAEFAGAHPGASASQIASISDLYRQQSDQSKESSLAQEAANLTPGLSLQSRLSDFAKEREMLQGIGADTLGVEEALQKAGTDAEQKWDEAAMAVGTFQEKMRAVANEIEIEGQQSSANFAKDWMTSLNSLSGDLAKFVLTGKNTMGQFLESIAQSTLTNTFKTAFGDLFKVAFGAPHAAGSGGGTSPGATGATLPGPLAAIGSFFGFGKSSNPASLAESFFGKGKNGGLFGGARDGSSPGSAIYTISADATNVTSLAGALPGGGSVLSSFPGFSSLLPGLIPGFAVGGRPSYGEPAIVGERGPELFVPDRNGYIYPGVPAGYHSRGGDTHHHQYNVNMHIETPNADTFRKSADQIHAEMVENLDRVRNR